SLVVNRLCARREALTAEFVDSVENAQDLRANAREIVIIGGGAHAISFCQVQSNSRKNAGNGFRTELRKNKKIGPGSKEPVHPEGGLPSRPRDRRARSCSCAWADRNVPG